MEIWKDIPGYEGHYLVSNKGRIIGLRRGLQKPSIDRYGYHRTALSKDGVQTSFYVHRLVAMAFIPNPDGKETVNHINENKRDNRVENLEWATIAEQNCYGTRMRRANESRKIPVIQIDEDGNEFRWPGIVDASTALGIPKGNIIKCCKNKTKSAGGFSWRYDK